ESSAWQNAAYILTYDEHGGYFDHVTPPVFDAYGAGIRVPAWVISPHAKKSHLETTVYEHTSTLKFIEAVLRLPTPPPINAHPPPDHPPVRRAHPRRPHQRGLRQQPNRAARPAAGRPLRRRQPPGVLHVLTP